MIMYGARSLFAFWLGGVGGLRSSSPLRNSNVDAPISTHVMYLTDMDLFQRQWFPQAKYGDPTMTLLSANGLRSEEETPKSNYITNENSLEANSSYFANEIIEMPKSNYIALGTTDMPISSYIFASYAQEPIGSHEVILNRNTVYYA